MTVFYPSNQQRIILDGSQTVLDIKDYWKSGDGKTFSTQYTALSGVNEKAREILDNFVNQDPPPSGTVWQSLQNLTSSYEHCSDLLDKMREGKVDTFAQQFYSVEFFVTGLNPKRERQTDTISANVNLFEYQMRKTAQFKKAFEDIVKLSRWPTYRDIVVETTIAGEFTVTRRPLYQYIEAVTLSTLLLLGVVCLVFKITQAYFPSIPAEPSYNDTMLSK